MEVSYCYVFEVALANLRSVLRNFREATFRVKLLLFRYYREFDPNFAMYMLSAPSTQALFAGQIRGTSYVGINLRDVRTTKLPVPPIAEQARIVKDLRVIRQKIEGAELLQSETEGALNAMLPSVLDKAFRGEW